MKIRILRIQLYIVGFDRYGPALGHGISSVQEQIEEDLLQFSCVPLDGRQGILEARQHLDTAPLQLVLDEAQRLADHTVDIEIREVRR